MEGEYKAIQIAGEILMLGYSSIWIEKIDNNVFIETVCISDGGQYSVSFEREYKNKNFTKILEKVKSIELSDEDDNGRLNWGISLFKETKDSSELEEEPLYDFGFWFEDILEDIVALIEKTIGSKKATQLFNDFINY